MDMPSLWCRSSGRLGDSENLTGDCGGVRSAPGFAAAVTVTLPPPVPDGGLTVSQSMFPAAVQAHVAPVVIVTVAAPPLDAMDCASGAIENVQGGGGGVAPACVTERICPSTVIVPVRLAVSVFSPTLYATDPLPLPAAPLVTVIHGTCDAAVHAHPECAVTVTEPVLAPAATLAAVGAIE
jgi:hypothetical protein